MLELVLVKKTCEEVVDGKVALCDEYGVRDLEDPFLMEAKVSKKLLNKIKDLNLEFPCLLKLEGSQNDYEFSRKIIKDKNGDTDETYYISIKDAQEISSYSKE